MESAGRANSRVSDFLTVASNVGKNLTVIAIGISLYSIATAKEWKIDLRHQVEAWVEAIFGGEFGVMECMVLGGPRWRQFGNQIPKFQNHAYKIKGS